MKKKFRTYYVWFISIMTILLSFVPGHNGDMPYYIACSIELEQGSNQDVLQKAKNVLEKELPQQEFVVHAKRIDEAPKNILDYYHIKPFYVATVAVLHKLGFSYLFATLLPSLISYFLIGILTFSWASKILRPVQAIIIGMLVMLTFPLITLARLSTPDGVSNLVLLACLYRLYFEKEKNITIILLLFSVFVRLDNFIAVLVLITAMKFWPRVDSPNKLGKKTYVLLILCTISLTVAINYYFEPDFWWFRNISYTLSIQEYGRELLTYFLSLSRSLLLAIILFAAIILSQGKNKLTEKNSYYIKMLLSIFIGRFLLFPSYDERFVSAYYIPAILILAETLNDFRAEAKVE